MSWRIKIDSRVAKSLKSLDTLSKKRIEQFIDQLAAMDNPRRTGKALPGKALQGNLKGLWRYRVGNYQLICQIKDGELIILVLNIGHRKDIYK